MDQTLYDQFKVAVLSLPEADILEALERAEHLISVARRNSELAAVYTPIATTGRPVDRILRVFSGRTFADIADVWFKLRDGFADELAKGGASAEVVHEIRQARPGMV